MPTRLPTAQYFKQIRSWEGRQTRAFEELCFQLRDQEPADVELRKTSDPDGGLEWYWVEPDGTEIGWQCKFSDNENSLLNMMDASFESVAQRRPKARRITFCLPVDLSDDPDRARGEMGWQRFEKLREKWAKRKPDLETKLMLGGAILERLALEQHRGREWFWFGANPILHPGWCREQLDVAVDSVDERYRPEINVDLPVAAAITSVALPTAARVHFDSLVASVSTSTADALEHPPRDGTFAEPLRDLAEAVRTLLAIAEEPWTPQRPLRPEFDAALAAARARTSDLLAACYGEAREVFGVRKSTSDAHALDERLHVAYHHEREAERLEAALDELAAWTGSPSRAAAEDAFVLLDGDGGAGKTHLFCHVAGRLIDDGHPVLLLLGQWFGAQPPWKTLAERIGGPDLSIEEVVVALEASAEASNKRVVLMIDAINDADDVSIWRKHLRELRLRLTKSRWIGVAMSCRTTYLGPVTPSGGFGSHVARATHPGFAGREFEAMERIFAEYGIVGPRVPLLLPEFTNPLFLILYSESVARKKVPLSGTAHLTAIFDAFVASRKDDIANALGLDPTLDPVGRAMSAITSELVKRGRDHLPYEQASALVTALDSSHGLWPETLFGRMLSEGLLTKDFAYLRDERREGEAVRFPFQRFSDHLKVGALLDAHLDPADPHASFTDAQPLGELVANGSLGSLEALAIQLPERCGLELPEVAPDTPEWRRRHALQAFVHSVPARDPKAVKRSRILPLLSAAEQSGLSAEVAAALVACAPLAEHALNGNWLHETLSEQALPARDAGWMQKTYWAFGETTHPLDRLIRWAERGPYPGYETDILELAAIPLAWTLASPNRFARDAATKSLTTLLVGDDELAERLVRRFSSTDDPYIAERLAAASYGALLRRGSGSDPARVVDLLDALVDLMESCRPNILLRDHVAGVARYLRDCHGHTQAKNLTARALPPYCAAPPTAPRGRDVLEAEYLRRGPDDSIGYASIQHSLFTDYGDFHKYVMSERVRNFLDQRLDDDAPIPGPGRGRTEKQFDDDIASCIIFETVIDLGWTPERFGEFDASVRHADEGRRAHKPERFGKKYQWIGLFELLARLADNYVLLPFYDDEVKPYEGAWQLSTRDIDPTLPPSRVRVLADERTRDPIFRPDPPNAWWVPHGPIFNELGAEPGAWAARQDDLPRVDQLFRRRGIDSETWIVLGGHLDYEQKPPAFQAAEHPRRDLGFSVHSALVRSIELPKLRTWFDSEADIMRSLPRWDAQAWGEAYLSEIPWSPASAEIDTGWEIDEYRKTEGFPDEALETAIPWHWPSGFDCSLDESLNVTIPSPQLLRRGKLTRDRDVLQWRHEDRVVVRFHETDEGWDRDWALLAREDWLRDLLADQDLVFVAGCYGERRVLGADMFSRDVFGWVDLGAGAVFAEGKWQLRGYDVLWDRKSEQDRPAK